MPAGSSSAGKGASQVASRTTLPVALAALLSFGAVAPSAGAIPPSTTTQTPDPALKLGPIVRAQAANESGLSRVIIRAVDRASLDAVGPAIAQAGGVAGRRLGIINARAAVVPNAALRGLAHNPFIVQISLDRPARGTMEATAATIGALAVRQEQGYDGAGVGVALIDSGIASWHEDLSGENGLRVSEFDDFVNGMETPYDDYGHGTHVAGIVAGNGYDSDGARAGIAPGAQLMVLKVLDASGNGRISDVIAALDSVVERKDALNIRVVNLSVAAGVYESYHTDPLTLAAKPAVEAGIVVVAAAGNAGRNADGLSLYGGVTAPANAPWVLTVGASNHQGTIDAADDTIAAFSSRGPAAITSNAKPELVAPGVGIESLITPESALYNTRSAFLLPGTVPTDYMPYLSLSGTSMAAPVVSGTIALMLQANPALTPNAVKAILQYTARVSAGYDRLTQGAGFVNAAGAVELARYFAAPADVPYPSSTDWSGQLIWGNHVVGLGRLTPGANAWPVDVTWGAIRTAAGEPVQWGVSLDGTRPWGTRCGDALCGTVQWGFGLPENVVWGLTCGG